MELFHLHDVNKSYMEIKGVFDRNNMTRLFRQNQAWIYDKHRIFVDLFLIPKLFAKTFTPKKYLITDKTMKPRAIGFQINSVDEYLNSVNEETK